jgi:hypothetical protein
MATKIYLAPFTGLELIGFSQIIQHTMAALMDKGVETPS